jgi:hypothetical protein
MPYVVTTIHNPGAIAATCRALGLAPPKEGSFQYQSLEALGWVVRLHGLRFPIVCDTLRGLIAYHSQDNAFDRYARLMRFVLRCYDAQARLCHENRGRALARSCPVRAMAA